MFQRLLQEAIDRLLREHLGRHLFVPIPIDYQFEHIRYERCELRILFFNPEGEQILGFAERASNRLPREMDRMIPEFIQHAYHNAFRDLDERLLNDVLRERATRQFEVSALYDELGRYYQGETRSERYFSLRNLEEQENHYARQLNYPTGTQGPELVNARYSLRLYSRHGEDRRIEGVSLIQDQSLHLYPNAEVTADVIRDRTNEVRNTIHAILEGREDPRFFTDRVERLTALRRLEHPALSHQVRQILANSRYGGRRETVRYSTATEVRERAEDQNRRIAAVNHPIAARLWGRLVREYYEQNPLVTGWDLAGEDETLTSAEKAAAEDRGMKLLLENLTREQREQYARTQSFYVVGGETGRIYEITRGKSQNVWVVEPKTYKKLQGLCFLPKGNLCIGDTMLTQKIALELEEKKALEVAIPFGPRNPMYDGTFSQWTT